MLTLATIALRRAFETIVSEAPPDNTPTWFAGWMTAAAAVATAVTAVFIFLQVRAGNDAVKVANRALDATRRQHAQSLYTTTETIKARIDANMPKITVTLPTAVRWPPQNPSSADSRTLEEVTFDREFRTNMDMSLRFVATVEVQVQNEGDKTTEVAFNGPLYRYVTDAYGKELYPDLQKPITKVTLTPGGSERGAFAIDLPMSRWVKILEQGEQDEPQDQSSLDVTYHDSLDTGAHDTQRIILSGTILLRVPGSRELFVVPSAPSVAASVQPTIRKYWLSRQSVEPLPEYAWESITPLEEAKEPPKRRR